MADQNPQGGSSPNKLSGKELLDSLRDQLKLETEYRDILKDSIKELQRSIKYHDQINSKIDALNTRTINTKDLEKQISDNKIKSNFSIIKQIDLQKKLNDSEKQQVTNFLKLLNDKQTLEDNYNASRVKNQNILNAASKVTKESVRDYYELVAEKDKATKVLMKARQKGSMMEIIAAQQALDLAKNDLSTKQQSLSLEEKNLINAKNLESIALNKLSLADHELQNAQNGLNVEQLTYAEALKSQELYKENNKRLEEQVEFEKKSNSLLGIGGGLVGLLASKFKVAEEVQGDMVEKAKLLVAEADASGKKYNTLSNGFKVLRTGLSSVGKSAIQSFKTDPIMKYGMTIGLIGLALKGVEKGFDMIGSAAKKTGEFLAGLSENSSNIVRGLTSGISSLVGKIPIVGGLLSGLIDGFSAVLDLVIGVDDYIVKAGRQIGLTAGKARELNRYYQELSYNSGNVFMNSKKYLESQVELSQQLGINNQFSAQILETNRMLKDFAGLEAQSRTEIAESSIITGKSSETIVKKITAQVVGLQKATGIAFNYQQIIKEAASLGGYLGLQFAKYPEKLTKALVTVKALGMDMKQLESMADSFLDFESSISKEFEAQLLTGKNINLQRARELFLQNDLAGAAMEINKQIGSSAEFMKMNRIAADSLASALGMSRDQMGDMLKKQELYSRLGAKGTENARELLKLGLQRFQNQKELTKAIGEEAYQSMVNASTQERLAEMIEKIKQSIVDFVERTNIIEKIENFVNEISSPENIKKILNGVKNIMTNAISIISDISSGILRVFNFISFDKFDLDKVADKIEKNSKKMIKNINSIDIATKVAEENATKIEKSEEKKQEGTWKGSTGIPKNTMSAAKIENPLSVENNKLGLESKNNSQIEALTRAVQEAMTNTNGSTAKNTTLPVVLQINNTLDTYTAMRGMKVGFDVDVTTADNRTPPYNTTTINFV